MTMLTKGFSFALRLIASLSMLMHGLATPSPWRVIRSFHGENFEKFSSPARRAAFFPASRLPDVAFLYIAYKNAAFEPAFGRISQP
jgi:hypothetical protein